jgi:hypothetical protein
MPLQIQSIVQETALRVVLMYAFVISNIHENANISLTKKNIHMFMNVLTNVMVYGTRRFNAAFTRVLQ